MCLRSALQKRATERPRRVERTSGTLSTLPNANLFPSWKEEVSRRVADHNICKNAGAHELQTRAEVHSIPNGRAARAAARVAARYANAPSYNQMLADEAHAAIRAAETAEMAETTRMLPRKWSWPVLRLPHRQNRSSSCRARPCGNLIANALGRCGLDRKPHRPAEKCRQLASQHPLPQPKSIRLPKCACNRSSRRILTRTQIASANRIFRRSRSPFPRISFSFPAKWLPLAVCGRAASRVRWRR